jgi:hypothetical protein
LAKPNFGAIERGLELAGRNSWEAIVERLEGHIEDVLQTRRELEVCAA